jgi:biotin operon repressor
MTFKIRVNKFSLELGLFSMLVLSLLLLLFDDDHQAIVPITAQPSQNTTIQATQEEQKAFDDMVNKTKSGLEGIISDALGGDGDKIKKAINAIEDVGFQLDSLTAKQYIINIFLNDENFENNIQSLGETMVNEFGRLENFSRAQGLQIGNAFIIDMTGKIEQQAPGTAATVQQIWTQIQTSSNLDEPGIQLLSRLSDSLKNVA